MGQIEIKDIVQKYDKNEVLHHMDLKIEDGEFFCLLGPSGCGKTTLLNIIGGFLTQTQGELLVDGREISKIPPHKREIGMVFQNYALFPHLSVYDNVAYGLKARKVPKKEMDQRVRECLESVRLQDYAKRMPHQLSGGQQQRVAIARALAIRPSILLMDEPLGNLDAKLRKEMQVELRMIQKRVGVTTIMVTHDQEEAMSLSDRICIMKDGTIQQIGTPAEIYRHPANQFVAGFLGQVNLTKAVPDPKGSEYYRSTDWIGSDGKPLLLKSTQKNRNHEGQAEMFLLRPQQIELALYEEGSMENCTDATVASVIYVGSEIYLTVQFDQKGSLQVTLLDTWGTQIPEVGQRVHVSWSSESLIPVRDGVA